MRHPIDILICAFAIPLLVAAKPATQPAQTPAPATTQSAAEMLAQLKQSELREFWSRNDFPKAPATPDGKPRKVADLFQLSIENNQLLVKPISGRLERCRMPMQGMDGDAVVAVGGDPNGPEGATYVYFHHADFSRPKEVDRQAEIMVTAQQVNLSGDLTDLTGSRNVQLIQSNEENPEDADKVCRVYVQGFSATDDQNLKLTLNAPSFVELRRRYPRECHTYLDPIFRQLQQESAVLAPDPKEALQVVSGPVPDDATLKAKVEAAVAKFDADNFQEREKASKELQQLGQPAATLLMHASRAGWSINKTTGVDDFLANYKALPQTQTRDLKVDSAFLIGCLYSDNAAVREGAARQLEQLAGSEHPLKIDPNLPPEKRDEQIDRLFARFLPATQPSSSNDAAQP
jgi:hypothetical protein